MKKISYFVSCCLFLATISSCSELDNYDKPSETLKGKIINKSTKDPIQAEAGSGSVGLKMLETSWNENPSSQNYNVKQDGTFINSKVFRGTYIIEPFGPFVPYLQKDGGGNVIVDDRKTVDIKGTTEVTFEVEPFLNVEWIGEPVLNTNGSITIKAKVTRGTTHADFQQNVTEITLFINSSSYYVGNNNYDNRYTKKITGDDAKNALGQEITITTQGEFSKNRDYYIRIGARIDKDIEGSKRFNYNEPKQVKVL